MKDMSEEYNKYLRELEHVLYTDTKEEISENELKLILFQLLKICLIKREYTITIKNYTINLTPQDLSVVYEKDNTYIEISNDDFYEETERDTEVRFFVISNDTSKESYEVNLTKAIRSEGEILNMDGECEEIYEFNLLSQFETDNIANYIKPDPNLTIHNETSATIKRQIHRDDPRTDVLDLLSGTNIIPVIYYERENIYVPTKEVHKSYEPNNYHELIPDNSDVIKIAKTIYSYMIDYYTNYMKENQ